MEIGVPKETKDLRFPNFHSITKKVSSIENRFNHTTSVRSGVRFGRKRKFRNVYTRTYIIQYSRFPPQIAGKFFSFFSIDGKYL